MPTPRWDNLDDFLDMDEFAVTCTVVQGGITRAPFTCIFDDPYFDTQVGEYNFDQTNPRIMGKAAAMAGIRRGAVATLTGQDLPPQGISLAVLDAPKPDGTGMAMLQLGVEP